MPTLSITPLTPFIGAEISGVDIARLDSRETADAIYDALIKYEVIFLRGQELTPQAHVAFARGFGELEPPHPTYPHVDGLPEVMVLDMGPHNPPDNDIWHTDVTFKANPAFASILYSRVIPPIGGDTMWSSMAAAYDALPAGIKADIAELRAVHDLGDFRNNFTVGEPVGRAVKLDAAYQRFGSAIHPLVKSHPVTGRKFLFVNPGFAVHVVGMNSVGSRRLLAYLFDHMTQPTFQVRFKWTNNTIAMWDNRCTMHLATGDYLPHRRVMHRITVVNDRRAGT